MPECSFVNWLELLLDTCCTGTNENTINHNMNDFKNRLLFKINYTEILIISEYL